MGVLAVLDGGDDHCVASGLSSRAVKVMSVAASSRLHVTITAAATNGLVEHRSSGGVAQHGGQPMGACVLHGVREVDDDDLLRWCADGEQGVECAMALRAV